MAGDGLGRGDHQVCDPLFVFCAMPARTRNCDVDRRDRMTSGIKNRGGSRDIAKIVLALGVRVASFPKLLKACAYLFWVCHGVGSMRHKAGLLQEAIDLICRQS